ncbi:outer membrane protein [Flavobacteriaceae bacterium UJ101]|nr:outer membrane protein [Flavobacteriaceae bacterium UJ101]
MKKVLLSVFALSGIAAFAQVDGLPANAEAGKCYAKCVTPEVWEDQSETIMTKPAYTTLDIVPAQYETRTETVEVKPASKKYIYVPAEYREEAVSYVKKEGYNKLEIVPEQFAPASQTLEVRSATEGWEFKGYKADCTGASKEDCRVMCYTKTPALYKDVPTQTKVKDQTTISNPVPEQMTSYTRLVEVSPARTDVIEIPAEYKEITKTVLVKDETSISTSHDAQYTTVSKRVLVQKGGTTEWKEVPCEGQVAGEILPIYYDTASAALRPRSKQVIDEYIYSKLIADPNATAEISSHTDYRGDDSMNQDLSERRAKSVVEYLISKGISKDRLVAIGYGETKPINGCTSAASGCSASQLQKNRRTEFRIY